VFNEEGNLVPVTVIDASACLVVGKRTQDKDKYTAVTLGFGQVKEKKLSKAMHGHFKKQGAEPRRHLKEFRIGEKDLETFKVGEQGKVSRFGRGQLVDVTGITKGRGYQGVMKRWSFAGFGQTHGTHEYRRHPGAVGQRKTPGRVYPNKKMPGHYGVEQVTTQNLTVVDVDAEKNLLLVKGAVPGHSDGIVFVRPSVKLTLRAQHAKK